MRGAGLHRLHAHEFRPCRDALPPSRGQGPDRRTRPRTGRTGERGAQACGRRVVRRLASTVKVPFKCTAAEHRGLLCRMPRAVGLPRRSVSSSHRGHVVVHKANRRARAQRKRRAVKRFGARANRACGVGRGARARACRRQNHSAWHASGELAARPGNAPSVYHLKTSGRLGHPDLEVVLGSFVIEFTSRSFRRAPQPQGIRTAPPPSSDSARNVSIRPACLLELSLDRSRSVCGQTPPLFPSSVVRR